MDLVEIAQSLVRDLQHLQFAPLITHVYNPLEYAWAPHADYLTRYGQGSKEVLLVGMNPGPWGMVQTGVPFGEVTLVRDWMGISGEVRQPDKTHPKRPVQGFACTRSEVSGKRLWGWARDQFDTPKRFFSRFFVANYCPLAFFDEDGKNRTPDKLPAAERKGLFDACDLALRRTVEDLRPRFVIGVGAFAEGRARTAVDGLDVSVGRVLHPSPASPAANRGWAAQAMNELQALGISLPGA